VRSCARDRLSESAWPVNPKHAEAVQQGRKERARATSTRQPRPRVGLLAKWSMAKWSRPRLTAAEKALLPQGFCSGCGKQGVVGAQHQVQAHQHHRGED
jgi:hypothetical protein